jgi:murein DD-endopeptidase MepM/ murein hydrolase activator NlpD
MGELLEKALDHSEKKGYFAKHPPGEKDRTRAAVQQVAASIGLPEEWVVKMVMIEAGGFNSFKDSGRCTGIVQVCRGESTMDDTGYIRRVGGHETWKKLGPAKQLLAWEKEHYDYWLKINKHKPENLGQFYSVNLYPAYVGYFGKKSKGITSNDAKIPAGKQAHILYDTWDNNKRRKGPGGKLTFNSMTRGLNYHAENMLGIKSTDSVVSNSPTGSLPGDVNNLPNITGNASVAKSAIINAENCPPPPFTIQDRIIYAGCQPKIQSAVAAAGMSLGSAAPGMASVNGEAGSSGGAAVIEGTINPGGFIYPCTGTLTSMWRRQKGAFHGAWDIAKPRNTPIYAVADGVVVATYNKCVVGPKRCGLPPGAIKGQPGFEGYGNIVYIDHGGGLFTLYAHNTSVIANVGDKVKQGQKISLMGDTGHSYGSHLHFEVRRNGKKVDPQTFFPKLYFNYKITSLKP